MIAPKVISHVQPTGRDYSQTTSPDLITEVPVLSPRTVEKVLSRPAHVPTHALREVATAGVNLAAAAFAALDVMPSWSTQARTLRATLERFREAQR